jgi:hypothetical protein
LFAARFVPLVVDPKKKDGDDRNEPDRGQDNLPTGRTFSPTARLDHQREISDRIVFE